MFCVGTTTDHVAPWRSVYKLHHETAAEITFVLTSRGHNAGIVSEPGHPHPRYRILTRAADAPCEAPEEWLEHARAKDGSWWPAWCAWLDARSGAPASPPAIGAQDTPRSTTRRAATCWRHDVSAIVCPASSVPLRTPPRTRRFRKELRR